MVHITLLVCQTRPALHCSFHCILLQAITTGIATVNILIIITNFRHVKSISKCLPRVSHLTSKNIKMGRINRSRFPVLTVLWQAVHMWLTCTEQSVLAAKLVRKSHHQSGRHHWRMESDGRRRKESAVVWRNTMKRIGHVGCIQSRKWRSNGRKVWCRYGSWSEKRKCWGGRRNSSSGWQRSMWRETLGGAKPQNIVILCTSHVRSTNCHRHVHINKRLSENRVQNNEINKRTVFW